MVPRSPMTRQLLAAAAMLAWGLLPGGAGASWRVREALRSDGLNQADYERMERGYYERLIDSGRSLGRLAEPAPKRAGGRGMAEPFEGGPLVRNVDDLREFILKPDMAYEQFGGRWSTNAQGMRDREYPTEKRPRTFRIALLGDSIGAGWGVDDGQGFEPILERRLDERSRTAGGPAVEILNFCTPGHGPAARWEHFRRIGLAFKPDLVVLESTLADAGWDERRLRVLLPRGQGWDVPFYREILAKAGARPGGDADAYKRAMRPWRWELLGSVYRAIAADCRARGIPTVWLLVPRVGKTAPPEDRQRMLAKAHDAAFTTIVDLSDVYDGLDPVALAIGPDDYHPNAEGHALLARRLEEALRDQPVLRQLWTPAGACR